MLRKRTAVAGIAVLIVGSMLAACGNDDKDDARIPDAAGQGEDALVKAAEGEGKVAVYWELPPPTHTKIEAAFEDKYPGVDVSILQSNQGVIIPKMDAEIDNDLEGADVTVNSAKQWIQSRAKAGDFLQIDNLPDSSFWAENTDDDLSSKYALLGVQVFGLAWNSDKVDEPLTSLTDLTRPEFKGRVGTFDLLAPLVAIYYDHIAEVVGGTEKLAAQAPWRLYSSTGPMLQALATGEIDVTAFVGTPAAEAAKAEGLPIEWTVPEEAAGAAFFGAVLENARHVNAAKLFMSFLLTPEGQAIIAADGNASSPLGPKLVPGSPDGEVTAFDPASMSKADYQDKSEEYRRIFLGE
jgi:iron(III) transport system substrate-binding protein